jgi:hypothetical protein
LAYFAACRNSTPTVVRSEMDFGSMTAAAAVWTVT